MRFAIVNNERTLPSAGLKGLCPGCGAGVIAKCGTERVHHWAHSAQRQCDRWWEPETEWHRAWKMNFSDEWQEVIRHAESGEKHIADILTADGLTIEFQHSHLRPEEREAREHFYGDMVWVVDGLRLKSDLPRLKDTRASMRPILRSGFYAVPFPEKTFRKSWLNSRVPVYFDFGCSQSSDDPQVGDERYLWCLLPERFGEEAVVLRVPRDQFIRLARENAKSLLARKIMPQIRQWFAHEHERRAREAHQRDLEWIARIRASQIRYRSRKRRRF